jgi:hypothetical protein
MAAWLFATCALVLFATRPLSSQQQPARTAASITGVVFDSLLRNAPLPGAEVTIDGTDRSAMTDANGRFRMDGVEPGQAVVRFYHASLDSLGFGAAPSRVTVPDSGSVTVRLATPSAERLLGSVCPGKRPVSTGVVIGRVRNVDDRALLANATASANWSEWSLGKGGLLRSEGRATASANANGAFALCGVPNDVPVVVRATAGGHVSGLVEVDLSQKLFAVRDFAVSLSDSGSSTTELARLDSVLARGDSVLPSGGSTVVGVVRGTHGRVVDRAQVGLLGFPIAVRTGSEGQFALARVPAGTQTVDVRAVGFAPQHVTVDLKTAERRTLEVTLGDAKAQELAPVNIVGRGTKLDNTGFEMRRQTGIGRYVTEEEIKARGVFETTQALWNVLGTRVVWNGYQNVVYLTRPVGTGRSAPAASGGGVGGYNNLCAPAYWVDGFAMAVPHPGDDAADPNEFVRPSEIRGIEVYVDPSAVPPQYRRPDVECGVVLIWTKPPRPKSLTKP